MGAEFELCLGSHLFGFDSLCPLFHSILGLHRHSCAKWPVQSRFVGFRAPSYKLLQIASAGGTRSNWAEGPERPTEQAIMSNLIDAVRIDQMNPTLAVAIAAVIVTAIGLSHKLREEKNCGEGASGLLPSGEHHRPRMLFHYSHESLAQPRGGGDTRMVRLRSANRLGLPERPLPKRLKPDEVWEIWTPLSQFSKALSDEAIFKRGRVRLSSGKVYNAKPEPKVVPLGNVPGGDVPPAVTGELVPPVKPQRMPSKRIVALLEAQLAEPIEEMRYDNPAVHEWYRITERLLGGGRRGRPHKNVAHFVSSLTRSGLTPEEDINKRM